MSASSRTKRPKAPPACYYDIGYAKPPAATRFQKGASGNPNGRPKGARNLKSKPSISEERLQDIILAEAYREIKINEGDKQITIPIAQAVIRSLAVNAAKGQPRAQKIFTDMVAKVERDTRQAHEELVQAALEYKLSAEDEIRYREAQGLPTLDILPHPEDMIVDYRTGEIAIKGPMTPKERERWRSLRARCNQADSAIEELEQMRQAPEHKSYRRHIEDDIAFEVRIRDMLENVIGDWDR